MELIESIVFYCVICIFITIIFLEYGAIDKDELKTPDNMVKSTLVEIIIQCGDKKIKKKVPKTILIQKLIVLIQRLLGLSYKPRLLYVCATQPDLQVELNDEGKELGRYSVNNGDKIIAVT